MADKMNTDYWTRFYGGADMDPSIPANTPAGSELTSRPVKTVAIDPFTGQPIAAGASAAPATVAALTRGNIQPKWADPSVLRFPQSAGGDRLPQGTAALPLNTSGGQYGAGNPLVLSALTAQQKANPAVAAATAVAQGNIKPGWINSPGFNSGPRFPVTATPEIRMAYSDMVAGKPGAQKRYAMLLADAAPTMGQTPSVPVVPVKTGPTGVGTNGYTYVNGQNMGYSAEEQAKRVALGQAIGDANRKNPNPTYTVSGDRNDFMPSSVQNSVRWQTGY